MPALGPPPAVAAPAAGQWTATVAADRKYFEANAIEGVEFPAGAADAHGRPARRRRCGSAGAASPRAPTRSSTCADADPGVSHSHALLTLSVDGVWLVSDLGSTNGTYVNDEQQPLTAGQTRALKDGDRVHVGAWTTITLHAPAQS